MSSPHPPARTKHKQPPAGLGIAAGAEDAKYQAKYKELKRKVRDIEAVCPSPSLYSPPAH
ncbi:hypothetical protein BDN70DRAFT_802718 [Pholiota conissans]|uniref:Uncharacterized protein n=1 Tax=Pholiota conissans TaxID=109636 RepID=A0A9P5Z5L5_9AGAR|nr:hypothetical protein BDN70DRAFT_802718 [Pholiota conissans]